MIYAESLESTTVDGVTEWLGVEFEIRRSRVQVNLGPLS